jgi:hypothetical protein
MKGWQYLGEDEGWNRIGVAYVVKKKRWEFCSRLIPEHAKLTKFME